MLLFGVSNVITVISLLAASAALASLFRENLRHRRVRIAASITLLATGLVVLVDTWVLIRPPHGASFSALAALSTLGAFLLLVALAFLALRVRQLFPRPSCAESCSIELVRARRELMTAIDSARIAREQAEHASQMKMSFLRMVSHELCTPLTSLKLNLDRLLREGSSSARQRESLGRMKESSDRLLALIEGLLEYARIESGRLSVEVEECDLGEITRELVDDLEREASAKQISLSLIDHASVPQLRTDRRLVRLVLVNLVGNAIKFTQRGGVEIELAFSDDEHRIVVRDTGPGIPLEARELIFEPFEQMEPIWNKHTRGLGLGLSIVRDTVGALGGRIELASRIDKGSTFTVILPSLETGERSLDVRHIPLDPSSA